MNLFKKLKLIVLLTILCVCSITNAQIVFGDLELTVLIDYTIPAAQAPVKATDIDLGATTEGMTDDQGVVLFQNLYIYTHTGIADLPAPAGDRESLEGLVEIFDFNGQLIDRQYARNGVVCWHGCAAANNGVYIAKDENNNTQKFFFLQQPTLLGHPFYDKTEEPQHKALMESDTTNLYNLWFDGRTQEFFPFDTFSVVLELFEGFNEQAMTPVSVPDAPSMGQLEILVDGLPCDDGAHLRLVRPGETDTIYFTTTDGVAVFDATAGLTSHPFGNFTREYLALISGDDFLSETNNVQMALGAGNNFTFNPSSLPLATGPVRIWEGSSLIPNVNVNMWRLINPADTFSYITNAAGMFIYEDIPVSGPTDYVFQSFKDDGVNPVLVSLDTATLVEGTNAMLNFYLEEIPQFFNMTGSVREFYTQSQLVSGVGMLVRDRNTGVTIDSTGTNASGFYSLHNIPAGLEAEIVMIGKANHFNRIQDYDFPAIVQSLEDSLISGKNTLHVPFDFTIPQTANDPAPATLVAVAAEVAEMVGPADEQNGEEIARFENRIYLTNFGAPEDSAFYHAAEQAIDSLFYSGQGSPLVLVPNHINISPYHQLNYNIYVGFPDQLGWNVTRGGGNITTPISSSAATGGYILGGQINITGNVGDITSSIKELQGRRLQLGDVTSRVSFMNIMSSDPNTKDRAYVHAILINHDARVMQSYEVFPLSGLSISEK